MVNNKDKYYTPLDMELRDLAAFDWTAFVQLIGDEAITKAKVCMLLKRGSSYNQIANRLKITKRKAQWVCTEKCNGKRT